MSSPNLDRYLRLLDANLGLNWREIAEVFGLDVYSDPIKMRVPYLRIPIGRSDSYTAVQIEEAFKDPATFALQPVFVHDTRTSCWWAPQEAQTLFYVRHYHGLADNLPREDLIVIAPTLRALRAMP